MRSEIFFADDYRLVLQWSTRVSLHRLRKPNNAPRGHLTRTGCGKGRCIRSSIGIGFSASFLGGTMARATTNTASVAATGVAAFDGAIKPIAKPSAKSP